MLQAVAAYSPTQLPWGRVGWGDEKVPITLVGRFWGEFRGEKNAKTRGRKGANKSLILGILPPTRI